MLPEVAEFLRNNEGSDEFYQAQDQAIRNNPLPRWRDTMTAEERAEYYAAEKTREMALLELKQAQREKKFVALDALKGHENPMIKWLVTDRVIGRDYTSFRDTVLRNLPMTREEIDAFGDKQGWCGDYARMLERAERAGVLPEPIKPLADIEPLVNALAQHWGARRSAVRNLLLPHLPALFESYEALKAEKEAEEKAKAEAEATKLLAETLAENSVRDETVAESAAANRARDERGRFATTIVAA